MNQYRVIHSHVTGKVCTEHGDLMTEGSTARSILHFEDLKEAKEHATKYIELHPEIGCEIWLGEEKIEEVKNEKAQEEFYRLFCTHSPMDKFKDAAVGLIFVASLIANVVMAFVIFGN